MLKKWVGKAERTLLVISDAPLVTPPLPRQPSMPSREIAVKPLAIGEPPRLMETDDDVILQVVQILFPWPESVSTEDQRSEFIKNGFSDFAHFPLLNWHQLLTRGGNWKALKYLSEWAILFFGCNISHPNAVLSFMRKQTRVIWALSQGETPPPMLFQTYGGQLSEDPDMVPWGLVHLTPDEIGIVSTVIEIHDDANDAEDEDDDERPSKKTRSDSTQEMREDVGEEKREYDPTAAHEDYLQRDCDRAEAEKEQREGV